MLRRSPTFDRTARGSTVLLIAASVGFTAAIRGSTAANALFVVPAVGLLIIAALRQASTIDDNPIRDSRLILAIWTAVIVTALSALLDVRFPRFGGGRETLWYWSASAWIVIVAITWLLARRRPDRLPVIVWSVLLLSAAEVGLLLWLDQTPGIDVYHLHDAAAHRLGAGVSPYRDLSVPNTSPFAEAGSLIDGYPYPPATLVWFALGSWVGDPRIASTIAWLSTLALIARPILKNETNRFQTSGFLLLLAVQPGWIFIVDQSWTEPFTLLLVVAAFVNWSRVPFASGLFLGLAVVSKQYMIVLIPATLMMVDDNHRKRVTGMATSALAVTLPFAIADFGGLWRSTVLFLLSTPSRPDASNLAGLATRFDMNWTPPAWLVLIVPTVVVMWIVRRTRRPAGLALAYAVGLAVLFFLASQAFANYWFLTHGLIVLAIVLSVDEPLGPRGSSSTPDNRKTVPTLRKARQPET